MDINNPTDVLVGMNLSEPHVEEKILAACQVRLAAEPNLDCVHLFLGGDDEVVVQRQETVASLKTKLDVIRGESRNIKPA